MLLNKRKKENKIIDKRKIVLKVKFFTLPQTCIQSGESFIEMFTAAPGQLHLKKVLSLWPRGQHCANKSAPGLTGSCPKLVSETLHSQQGQVSKVRSKVACALWEMGGKGLVLLMTGKLHGLLDSVTDALWLEMTFALFKFYPIWLLLLSYTNDVRNQKLTTCHVATLSVIILSET